MSCTGATVYCRTATVITAHGSPAQLDTVIEVLLTLGTTTLTTPPEPCPDRPGCHVLGLGVVSDLPLEQFHDALRAVFTVR
jgi:hypothetical protein